jgi:hypothetical protein
MLLIQTRRSARPSPSVTSGAVTGCAHGRDSTGAVTRIVPTSGLFLASREDPKQVTNQVTTAPDNARPGPTSSDTKLGLTCDNQTQCDILRRNHAAWHAEGQGFEFP